MRGTLLIALAACGGSHESTRPDTPVPASITIHSGTGALDAIGATLQLSATVTDAHGQSIANPSLTWHSANDAIASVNASGLVTAMAVGTTQITAASGTVQEQIAVAVAPVPSALATVSGDGQTGTTGSALTAPLVVQVKDRLGHSIAGVSVAFAVTGGGGTIAPDAVSTNEDGKAEGTWTLGAIAGPQAARATVAGLDTLVFAATAQGLAGSPTITSIAPDTLVEGQSITITGTNFDATPANNVVTIDGVGANVSAASATSLTVVVPSFACRPVRLGTVTVQKGGLTVASTPVPVRPASFTTLEVGEELIVQDPSKFCFQFPAKSFGAESYLIGLSAPAEQPGATLPFSIHARSGASSAAFVGVSGNTGFLGARAPLTTVQRSSRQAMTGAPASMTRSLALWRERASAEAKLRRWEAARLPALMARRERALRNGRITADVHADVPPVPSVGDTLAIRVPDISADDACASFIPIRAVVRVVGSAGIWVQDIDNPTTDSLTIADIQSASNQFDSKIYATDTTYFGAPSDIDNNQRVIVVLTREVNKSRNILGFVFSGDLFSTSDCAQSNGGELYYGEVPDPDNTTGTGARNKADVIARMPQLIAHEFTHVIQFSQRAILNAGAPMAGWEMEGQATFAEELVGNAVLGNASGQNYDRYVAFGPDGFDWYADEIEKWAAYYGAFASGGGATPDLCTVYGNLQLSGVPCDPAAFYGASWILQRYIADQYAASYPGGLKQLTRDWVSKNIALGGTANIKALLGVDYDQLFVRFATALALDDRVSAAGSGALPSQFSITSWNSSDLAAWLHDCCSVGWLSPTTMAFATATSNRSVRGGSTAYTMLDANITQQVAGHPATAIQVTDLNGEPVGTGLRPALWIVRVQ
jgi:hypothetical protein